MAVVFLLFDRILPDRDDPRCAVRTVKSGGSKRAYMLDALSIFRGELRILDFTTTVV